MKLSFKFLCALIAAAPLAAAAFPTKPVKLIVPFAAGGPADLVARQVAEHWSQKLGQPVLVENQGGGAGVLAMNGVLRAPADGHTVLFAASGNIVAQPILTGTEEEVAKLVPVALVSTSPHVLVVSAKLPVTNMAELIAYAKANPGKVNFGSAGVGGVAHLGMELLKVLTKTELVHVPYRGTSQVTKDLISGEVQALFSSLPSLKQHIDAGRIRAVGMSAPSDSVDARAIPPISQTIPGFEYTTWYGTYTTPGTPAAAVDKLNVTLREVLASSALRQKLEPQGVKLEGGPVEKLKAIKETEAAKWRPVIRDANISLK